MIDEGDRRARGPGRTGRDHRTRVRLAARHAEHVYPGPLGRLVAHELTAYADRDHDLHPGGPLMVGGLVLWPLEQAHEVLGVLRDLAPAAPDDLGVMLVAHRAPPAPFVPPEHVGRPVLGLVLVWAGEPAAG